jgi:peptide-methionine (S)-S-oxide reductase
VNICKDFGMSLRENEQQGSENDSDAISEIAYFATGCFWGAERRFWNVAGVIETSVGYMGGRRANPNYEQVCTGTTGHTEAVMVRFDPKQVTYQRLLEEFWTMHDPTSLNRQGNDIGTQYRSAIFTTNQSQRDLALATRKIYQDAIRPIGYGEIVTEISDASLHPYWVAEEYHQKYLAKNPNGYDCHSSTGVAFPLTTESILRS